MRLAALMLGLAACGADDVVETDAGSTYLTCNPAATASPAPTTSGPLLSGTFTVQWSCVEGCDAPPSEQIMLRGTSLGFITEQRGEHTETFVTWSIGGEPLWPIKVEERDGCWYRYAPLGGCMSDFYICNVQNRPTITHLADRNFETGAEQVWRMN